MCGCVVFITILRNRKIFILKTFRPNVGGSPKPFGGRFKDAGFTLGSSHRERPGHDDGAGQAGGQGHWGLSAALRPQGFIRQRLQDWGRACRGLDPVRRDPELREEK